MSNTTPQRVLREALSLMGLLALSPAVWFPHGVPGSLSHTTALGLLFRKSSGPCCGTIESRCGVGLGPHSTLWEKWLWRFGAHGSWTPLLTEKKLSTQILNDLPEVSFLVVSRARPRCNDSWLPSAHFYLKYPVMWSKFSQQNNSFKHIIVLRKWIWNTQC